MYPLHFGHVYGPSNVQPSNAQFDQARAARGSDNKVICFISQGEFFLATGSDYDEVHRINNTHPRDTEIGRAERTELADALKAKAQSLSVLG